MTLSVSRGVDLRREPVDEVLDRVEQSFQVRLDQQTIVRKRRSVGARTDRHTWVRIERHGFDRIGTQGWNGPETAAVLSGVAMSRWFAGFTWREQDEPLMWRADEFELAPAAPVGKAALVIDWEDWGTAPRGLDAATLWGNSLAAPKLAQRVWNERRQDLETRTGRLNCAVLLREGRRAARSPAGPTAGPVRREAARLVAELDAC